MRPSWGGVAAGLGLALGCCAAPAAATPDLVQTQYTLPHSSFRICTDAARRALTIAGFAVAVQDERIFYGAKPDAAAVINCYQSGDSAVYTTTTVSTRGHEAAVESQHTLLALMFPEGSAAGGSCADPISRWRWFNGALVTINADGTVSDDRGGAGAWVKTGADVYEVHWTASNGVDRLTLSDDGMTLRGLYNGQKILIRRENVCS